MKMKINFYKDGIEIMSSEKQLILIILVWVAVFGYQYYKNQKKKNEYYKKYRKSQGWE